MKTLPKIGSKVVCLGIQDPYRYWLFMVDSYVCVYVAPDESEMRPYLVGPDGYGFVCHSSNITPFNQLSIIQKRLILNTSIRIRRQYEPI